MRYNGIRGYVLLGIAGALEELEHPEAGKALDHCLAEFRPVAISTRQTGGNTLPKPA
jgi:hypothetical protein